VTLFRHKNISLSVGPDKMQPFIRIGIINPGFQDVRRKFYGRLLAVWWSKPWRR